MNVGPVTPDIFLPGRNHNWLEITLERDRLWLTEEVDEEA